MLPQGRNAFGIERAPGQRGVAGRINPFRQPESHEEIFVGSLAWSQLLLDCEPAAETFHPHEPGLGPFLSRSCNATATDRQPSMGAWANAGIVMPTPVDEVVPAFCAGPRMVGDFVGWQTGVTANCLGGVIELARQVVIGHDQLAGLVQAKKRRVGFDGQLVQREMFGRLGDRAPEFPGPLLGGLARTSIDQVERVAIKNGTGDRNCIKRLLRGVEAAQFL